MIVPGEVHIYSNWENDMKKSGNKSSESRNEFKMNGAAPSVQKYIFSLV